MSGRFIVIEGINGSGGETQSKKLVSYLMNKGIPAERINYPEYGHPIGNAIRDYLFGKYEPNPITLFLLYASDMIKDMERVRSMLANGKWVVADRHFPSTIAYQCIAMKALSLGNALRFAEIINIPRPDSIIYLRVSVETSVKRKQKEEKQLDRHESDHEFQSRIMEAYEELLQKNIFGKWTEIDAERGIEEVFESIKRALGI